MEVSHATIPWLVVVVVLLQPLLTMHLGFLLAVDPNDVAYKFTIKALKLDTLTQDDKIVHYVAILDNNKEENRNDPDYLDAAAAVTVIIAQRIAQIKQMRQDDLAPELVELRGFLLTELKMLIKRIGMILNSISFPVEKKFEVGAEWNHRLSHLLILKDTTQLGTIFPYQSIEGKIIVRLRANIDSNMNNLI